MRYDIEITDSERQEIEDNKDELERLVAVLKLIFGDGLPVSAVKAALVLLEIDNAGGSWDHLVGRYGLDDDAIREIAMGFTIGAECLDMASRGEIECMQKENGGICFRAVQGKSKDKTKNVLSARAGMQPMSPDALVGILFTEV
jgi:hypothetical protein